MKKLIILSFIAVFFMTACNEKPVIETDDQVGISKITYYPTLTLQGSDYMAVAQGTAFTDPGATAEAGGASVTVETSGTVNTSTVGVYIVTYVATNTDGFSASTQRFVAVYSTDAGAAANDYSGNYARTSNGSVATWTKLAPGCYKVVNVGGAPTDANKTVIAFNPTSNIINVPAQTDNGGTVTRCTSSTGGANITYNTGNSSYAWIVINPGYGTGLRTFVKQ